jgi:hypothetical protein
LGDIPIDSRDGVRDMITVGKIDLYLKFHFFRPGAGFPGEPDFQRHLSVYFDRELDWTMEQRFYFEKFLNLNGDFNGDGKRDLLVRDHSDEISVYFFNSRETGFSARPDVQFSCPESMDWWIVKDLNGDGVSDLVINFGIRTFTGCISARRPTHEPEKHPTSDIQRRTSNGATHGDQMRRPRSEGRKKSEGQRPNNGFPAARIERRSVPFGDSLFGFRIADCLRALGRPGRQRRRGGHQRLPAPDDHPAGNQHADAICRFGTHRPRRFAGA